MTGRWLMTITILMRQIIIVAWSAYWTCLSILFTLDTFQVMAGYGIRP